MAWQLDVDALENSYQNNLGISTAPSRRSGILSSYSETSTLSALRQLNRTAQKGCVVGATKLLIRFFNDE